MHSKEPNFFKKVEPNNLISIIDEKDVERNITIAMAEVKFGIKWLEHDQSYADIYEKLQVRYMGEILGWGLFAKKDFVAGETVGVLTGEVYFQNRNEKVTSKHILLSDAPNNQFQVVDAERSGNLTRFIQHLPTDDIIDGIKFQEEHIKKEVATSNIKHSLIELKKGIVTEHYSASKDIKAGEILGANYAPQFWLEKRPLLLKKNGIIVEENLYSYPPITPGLKQ